jgi:hypothetical protein
MDNMDQKALGDLILVIFGVLVVLAVAALVWFDVGQLLSAGATGGGFGRPFLSRAGPLARGLK